MSLGFPSSYPQHNTGHRAPVSTRANKELVGFLSPGAYWGSLEQCHGSSYCLIPRAHSLEKPLVLPGPEVVTLHSHGLSSERNVAYLQFRLYCAQSLIDMVLYLWGEAVEFPIHLYVSTSRAQFRFSCAGMSIVDKGGIRQLLIMSPPIYTWHPGLSTFTFLI